MNVAIVMATYNGEKYIAEQIDSIIAQTYQNWKLFIHDDGSSDSTIKIIHDYEKKDSRICLVDDDKHFHNSSANFFHLLKNLDNNNDYICLCDQDDIWEKNKIAICVSELQKIEKDKNMPVCIATDMALIDSNGNKYVESFWKYAHVNQKSSFATLLIENTATGCTMMFNHMVLNYINKLSMNEIEEIVQHDWYIALICASDGIYNQCPIQTVLYRQHENNVVGAKKLNIIGKFVPEKLINSCRRILKLKYKVKKQANIVSKMVDNIQNADLANQYSHLSGIKNKVFLIQNRIYRDTSNLKQLLKICFY